MCKILSLIIPVYNVEAYIEECINSIILQLDNRIEVIIVNDGTPDNSMKIIEHCLEGLPKKLQDCFIILNQENQGQSCARNTALDIAKGEYIGFIDSDDFVDKNYVIKLFNIINGSQPDIISIKGKRFIDIANDQKSNFEMQLLDKVGLHELNFNLKTKIFNRHHWFIWSYIIKKSLIKDNAFIPKIYFEDAIFVSSLIIRAKNIYFYNEFLYYYRINCNGSLLSISSANIQKNMDSYNFVINYFYNKIKSNSLYSVSYIISLQSYLSYLRDKRNISYIIMEYYKFKDFDKCVDKKTIINKGNLLFYKLGVIFIIFLYATRK